MIKIENLNKIIVANWKLNGSQSFVKSYLDEITIKSDLVESKGGCVVICPPTPFIHYFSLKDFFIGAQDCSIYNEGAFTGEISAKILKDLGCDFCIIGHSERRNFFKESNEIILKKINHCINNKIIPILCVGENLNQKKQNLTKKVLKEQLVNCLSKNINLENLIIAYEPIWSIGTGVIPKIEEVSNIHKFIKNEIFSESRLKILYGGSVKANNYKELINLPDVDGLLVGGASLNIDEFNEIIQF